ncbi:MAG: glutamine-hydrolyzing GMP synthase [Patescibacteria group bacterium]
MPHSSPNLKNDVFVLDFGSQYSPLIARRIRSFGVTVLLVPYTYPLTRMRHAKGIILSGGPDSVYEKGAARVGHELFSMGVPILGICYGMQLMAYLLKGKVVRSKKREYGPALLTIHRENPLFYGIPKQFSVWMSHGDRVEELPQGFQEIGSTPNSPVAAMENSKDRLLGIQFHPEVEHTHHGGEILKNFVFRICECKPTVRIRDFIQAKIDEIRTTVGKEHVICATSGGVDSSAVAALMRRAVGKQLSCIFVNSGTLRKGEPSQVLHLLRSRLKLRVRSINAEQRFLRALKGVTYGEQKRKIIGREFIYAFKKAAASLSPRPIYLAQGTIHSDVIESAGTKTGKKTHIIKTHHNVGGLPNKLKWKLIEPLRDLFKDEVRALGKELGLPEELLWRQPFPGPGLAIRAVGEVTKQKLEILRNADFIVRQEIEKKGLARNFYQYFAILLNDKTVGVRGDQRAYAYPLVVKVVVSSDIMTSDWARLSHDFLAHLSWRITNEVPQITRVLYDITSKPPATTEWE